MAGPITSQDARDLAGSFKYSGKGTSFLDKMRSFGCVLKVAIDVATLRMASSELNSRIVVFDSWKTRGLVFLMTFFPA
jgi:hypothetical protein